MPAVPPPVPAVAPPLPAVAPPVPAVLPPVAPPPPPCCHPSRRPSPPCCRPYQPSRPRRRLARRRLPSRLPSRPCCRRSSRLSRLCCRPSRPCRRRSPLCRRRCRLGPPLRRRCRLGLPPRRRCRPCRSRRHHRRYTAPRARTRTGTTRPAGEVLRMDPKCREAAKSVRNSTTKTFPVIGSTGRAVEPAVRPAAGPLIPSTHWRSASRLLTSGWRCWRQRVSRRPTGIARRAARAPPDRSAGAHAPTSRRAWRCAPPPQATGCRAAPPVLDEDPHATGPAGAS